MVDFSSGYVPPGVYVATQSTGSLASVGVGATVVCLVGAGIGYETYTDNLSFATQASLALTKSYVNESSIVVTAIMDSGLTTFTLNTDYTLSVTNNVTTITRVNGGTLPTDRLVSVAYKYADDDYFALNKFSDYSTLTSVYGNPLDPTTGAIASPVAFAAQLAFRNGANVVYVIAPDVRNTGLNEQEQFAAAYAVTLGNYEINLVVPLWDAVSSEASAISYLADMSQHLQNADSANQPRMALCGVAQGYATTDIDTVAQSVQYNRIVLFWPQAFTYFNAVLNGSATCDGYYLAAAVAGVMVSNDVARGITHSTVNSFTGIGTVAQGYTESQKNTWASRGVTVAEMNRTGALWIRHGLTTDVSNIGTREISIVRCQDALFESIALTLEGAELIGDPITSDTPTNITSLVQGALEGALTQNIIQAYTDIVSTQGSLPGGDPTVITVTFSYYPTYPLNYITVTFTLDLTTGNLTQTTTDNSSNPSLATTS